MAFHIRDPKADALACARAAAMARQAGARLPCKGGDDFVLTDLA